MNSRASLRLARARGKTPVLSDISSRLLPFAGVRGFTLLEVIVALAITGFLLGGLFTLLAGSKQLSWRSEASLVRAVNARAQINFAQLVNELNDVEPILENDRYASRPGELLEEPERKTQPLTYALETFEVLDDDREEVIVGTRWIQLEVAR